MARRISPRRVPPGAAACSCRRTAEAGSGARRISPIEAPRSGCFARPHAERRGRAILPRAPRALGRGRARLCARLDRARRRVAPRRLARADDRPRRARPPRLRVRVGRDARAAYGTRSCCRSR
jgi:hypothetical protein